MPLIMILLIVAGGYWCWKRLREQAKRDEEAFEQTLANLRTADVKPDDTQHEDMTILSGFKKAKRGTKNAYQNITDPVYRFFSCVNCDKCCAESRFVAFKGDMSLFFCAHHSKAYEDALSRKGFTVLPNHVAELAA